MNLSLKSERQLREEISTITQWIGIEALTQQEIDSALIDREILEKELDRLLKEIRCLV